MADFEVRLQVPGEQGDALPAQVQVEDGRFRVRTGRERFGSWSLEEILVERLSPFRFQVVVDGDPLIVFPDDPTGFADATHAFVDLRTSRFGLAERLRKAAG